jgi:hypothetical protein
MFKAAPYRQIEAPHHSLSLQHCSTVILQSDRGAFGRGAKSPIATRQHAFKVSGDRVSGFHGKGREGLSGFRSQFPCL